MSHGWPAFRWPPKAKGMEPLCDALNVERKLILKALEVPGGAVRHGKADNFLESEREVALLLASTIIERFVAFVQQGETKLSSGEYGMLEESLLRTIYESAKGLKFDSLGRARC